MHETEIVHQGLRATLRRLTATLLAIVQNRLELLAVELQEERAHLIKTVLLTAVIVALGAFTLAMAACALSIVVWNQFGVQGLWALSGLGLAGTVLAYCWLRTRLKHWRLLPDTLAELKKDRACLGGRL